jgi:hypothetical protein
MKNAGILLLACLLLNGAVAQTDSVRVNEPLQNAINHHASRYAFAPSAFPVPKGGFYYQTYDFVAHDVQIGISENTSLGIGYALPLFAYLTPKTSTALSEKVRVGLGDLAATSMFLPSDDAIRFNIAYGGLTYGTTRNNASLSLGYLSSNKTQTNSFVLNGGGMYSISPNIYLVGEVWFNQAPFSKAYSASTWLYDDNGLRLPMLDQNGNPITGYYQVKESKESFEAKQQILFGSLQFRIIGSGSNTRSWAFGLSFLSLSGDEMSYEYQYSWGEQQTYKVGAVNTFLFLPSVTYIKKFGDLSGFN